MTNSLTSPFLTFRAFVKLASWTLVIRLLTSCWEELVKISAVLRRFLFWCCWPLWAFMSFVLITSANPTRTLLIFATKSTWRWKQGVSLRNSIKNCRWRRGITSQGRRRPITCSSDEWMFDATSGFDSFIKLCYLMSLQNEVLGKMRL